MAGIIDQATIARLEVLVAWKDSNKLPTSDGVNERNLSKAMLDMETFVSALESNPPMQTSTVSAIIKDNKEGNQRNH